MTKQYLAKIREKAEKHAEQRSARLVLELLDEIGRLRALWDRNEIRRGVVSDESLMSFGEYKGERMADVPEDYLLWWLNKNDRGALKLDADFGQPPKNFIARGKLRLYDYIQQRIRDETAYTAETAKQTAD